MTGGGFGSPILSPSNTGPLIATGFFDDDTDLDVAVTYGSSVLVHLGNGDGTFDDGVFYPGAQSPAAILVGDFDGDGIADIAEADQSFSTPGVVVLLGLRQQMATFLVSTFSPLAHPGSAPALRDLRRLRKAAQALHGQDPESGPGRERRERPPPADGRDQPGTSSIDAIVRRKPTHVWIVSAVPMYCGSESSVTHAENCAESATTDAPQMAATVSRSQGFRRRGSRSADSRRRRPPWRPRSRRCGRSDRRRDRRARSRRPRADHEKGRRLGERRRAARARRSSRGAKTGTQVHIA